MSSKDEWLKIRDGLQKLEITEQDWLKQSFIELAKDHKTHCQGCSTALLSLRIALEKLGIKVTTEEGMNFC